MTNWTRKKLADYLEECRANEKVIHLEGEDLSWMNLQDLDFAGAKLQGATLRSSILDRSDFSFSDLSGARLKGTSASETMFTRADLAGADFTGSKVENACFRDANLTRTDFYLTRLALANLNCVKAIIGSTEVVMYHTCEGHIIHTGEMRAGTLEDLLEAAKSGEKGRILPRNFTLEKELYLLAPYLEWCAKKYCEYLTKKSE